MLHTGTKFTSPKGRLEMTMNKSELEVEKTAEIESTIEDLLNRSLNAINTLRRIIRETITLQKDAD